MELSIENGTVVCSMENKSSGFLMACTGLFSGFMNGKLKMYTDDPKEFYEPNAVVEFNAMRLSDILHNAKHYGVTVSVDVEAFNAELQAQAAEIKERERALEEEQRQREYWQLKCKHGCGECRNLAYDIDLPICKATGAILKEENEPKYVSGVLRLFNLEPFPSENCPFNINKKQGVKNV